MFNCKSKNVVKTFFCVTIQTLSFFKRWSNFLKATKEASWRGEIDAKKSNMFTSVRYMANVITQRTKKQGVTKCYTL